MAFYCTLDFILGKMGWKQGDHLEGYIQVSYDGGRSGEKELDSGSVLTGRLLLLWVLFLRPSASFL